MLFLLTLPLTFLILPKLLSVSPSVSFSLVFQFSIEFID